MQSSTGKPPRQPRAPKPLPPFDPLLRYTVDEAAALLKSSRPTIYKDLRAGRLEAVQEGARTFITGRSIAARCAPTDTKPWAPNPSFLSRKKRGAATETTEAAT